MAFRRNYWAAVLVAFVMALLSASGARNEVRNTADTAQQNYYNDNQAGDTQNVEELPLQNGNSGLAKAAEAIEKVSSFHLLNSFWKLFSVSVLLILSVAAIFFGIFVGNVLLLGGTKFFIENKYGKPRIGTLIYGFRCGYYGNIVKTMFLMDLYIFLWTLLLIIPGIIKGYEYRMVPYILAEHPEMNSREIFALSKEMMMNQKMNAFILDLSFIPWILLTGVTAGLAGIFYVYPYMEATDAELYAVLSEDGMPESPYTEI